MCAAAATVAGTPAARAGGWLAGSGSEPIEQRVAVAVTPTRTTVWTSVRLTAPAGPVAIVVPAAPGASLDVSSDAWFEALEVATAPRVFPPDGASPWCPGEDGEAHPFHVAGDLDHQASAALGEVVVLPDAASVGTWATEHGFTVSPAVAQALGSMSGVRFVVAQLTSGGVEMVTPTLRVVSTGAAALPLALTAAGNNDLRVTTWLLGAGRAKLGGTTVVSLDPASLEWNASDATSNLDEARLLALQGVPSAALVEAASHAALSQNVAIADGTSAIDGVAGTFFERAAAYAEIGADPAACTTQAAIALASSAPVGTGCPRADLGVVDGVESCEEAAVRGQTAPAALRCGTLADDLAVALSGAVPADIWLTRASVLVPAGGVGTPYAVSFADAAEIDPVLTAEAIDVSDCEAGEGGSGPGAPAARAPAGRLPGPEPGPGGGVPPGAARAATGCSSTRPAAAARAPTSTWTTRTERRSRCRSRARAPATTAATTAAAAAGTTAAATPPRAPKAATTAATTPARAGAATTAAGTAPRAAMTAPATAPTAAATIAPATAAAATTAPGTAQAATAARAAAATTARWPVPAGAGRAGRACRRWCSAC
ncbi:MAG: DUF2330 domain-containing protein [Polyangiaceae bacterium]